MPPSIGCAIPVIKSDSSLAKYTASDATSAGVPILPIGWRAIKSFFAFIGSLKAFTLSSHEGVWIVPGAIALHLILFLIKSAAIDLVKPIIAALPHKQIYLANLLNLKQWKIH